MPKILPELKRQLIETAKKMIREEGCERLSIRALANECNIATGTLYNYFKNKEDLFVGVILDGWQKYLCRMDEVCRVSGSFPEATQKICCCIEEFISEYSIVWKKFGNNGYTYSSVSSYHMILRNQIKERIENAAKTFSQGNIHLVADLLAESVLTAAIQPDLNEKDVFSLASMLTNKKEEK